MLTSAGSDLCKIREHLAHDLHQVLHVRDRLIHEVLLLRSEFECHDLLEEAWASERGEERAFLKALIHVSVGLYHLAAGNPQGAVNLLTSGVEGLRAFPDDHRGLDVAALAEKSRVCLLKAERSLEGSDVSWSASDVPTMASFPAGLEAKEMG